MWGQRAGRPSAEAKGRNTPTYVGTTLMMWSPRSAPAEHPHVCGDNGCTPKPLDVINRNTPTYVGTTALREYRIQVS